MAIIESVRKKLSHRLESHQIDEDYSPRISRNHSVNNSVIFNETLPFDANDLNYDQSDIVPSYEASQLLHEQSQHGSVTSMANQFLLYQPLHSVPSYDNTPHPIRRQISSNHINQLTVDHIAMLSNSTHISRRNSVVAGSTTETSSNSGNVESSNGPSSGSNGGNGNNGNNTSKSLKNIGLQFLNAKQHFALACCRDLSLIPCFLGLIKSWKMVFIDGNILNTNSITSAKLPEHFLTGVWCIVAGYLSYSVLDSLMIRWIVTYSTGAAILRMLSMSTIIVTIEQYLLSTFSPNGYQYGLHIWILISCCLTLVYIVQNFVTSNLDLKGKQRARFFDFYNIVVFAVVPVGLASFITMIGLLRSLLIVRLDIEKENPFR